MKKLIALSLIGTSLFIESNPAKADWDKWGTKSVNNGSTTTIQIYKIDTSNNTETLFGEKTFTNIGPSQGQGSVGFDRFEDTAGKIIFQRTNPSEEHSFNLSSGTWVNEGASWNDNFDNSGQRPVIVEGNDGSLTLEQGGKTVIGKNTDGEIHLGENSWITKEENGRQKVYAKDAAGNPIPIDYTNGTKLLINGRDVEQSINNVGALSAALTGLPTVPNDTNLACGLGTGTHGSDFAFSGGCASKVNEKLSINYAASMTIPGQDYVGDFENQFSARAGFVWKLGKATKPTQVSIKDKKVMEAKINTLTTKNETLQNTVSKLMARLERLEKVALSESESTNLAVYPLK